VREQEPEQEVRDQSESPRSYRSSCDDDDDDDERSRTPVEISIAVCSLLICARKRSMNIS